MKGGGGGGGHASKVTKSLSLEYPFIRYSSACPSSVFISVVCAS